MNEGHRNRAFTDSRSHALQIPRAHVANGEDARQAGFQQERLPGHWPVRAFQVLLSEICSGFDESTVVTSDTAAEPRGIWYRADHREQPADGVCLDLACLVFTPFNSFQTIVTSERSDFGLSEQLDFRTLFDSSPQVARHRVRQTLPADEQVNAFRGLREKHRC